MFVGTRVPLQNLIDALEGGESVEDFLEGFPFRHPPAEDAVNIEAGQMKMLETVGYECADIGTCRLNEQRAGGGRAVTGF